MPPPRRGKCLFCGKVWRSSDRWARVDVPVELAHLVPEHLGRTETGKEPPYRVCRSTECSRKLKVANESPEKCYWSNEDEVVEILPQRAMDHLFLRDVTVREVTVGEVEVPVLGPTALQEGGAGAVADQIMPCNVLAGLSELPRRIPWGKAVLSRKHRGDEADGRAVGKWSPTSRNRRIRQILENFLKGPRDAAKNPRKTSICGRSCHLYLTVAAAVYSGKYALIRLDAAPSQPASSQGAATNHAAYTEQGSILAPRDAVAALTMTSSRTFEEVISSLEAGDADRQDRRKRTGHPQERILTHETLAVIRRVVDKSILQNGHPNSRTIQTSLRADYNLFLDRRSIRRALNTMGYFFGKVLNLPAGRKRTDVVMRRDSYLRAMDLLRDLEDFIVPVYFDETYMVQGDCGNYFYMKGRKMKERVVETSPVRFSGGKRLCIIHAATSDEGLLKDENGASMALIGSEFRGDDGEIKSTISTSQFMVWFEKIMEELARKYGRGPCMCSTFHGPEQAKEHILPERPVIRPEAVQPVEFVDYLRDGRFFPAHSYVGGCTVAQLCAEWAEQNEPLLRELRASGRRVPVLVFDNASYHTTKTAEFRAVPTSASKKSYVIDWILQERNICPVASDSQRQGAEMLRMLRKKELLTLVDEERRKFPVWARFELERVAMQNFGFLCLRTPPYHPELQPIELLWNSVKARVRRRVLDENLTFRQMQAVLEEEFDNVDLDEWKCYEQHARLCEERYRARNTQEEALGLETLNIDLLEESGDEDDAVEVEIEELDGVHDSGFLSARQHVEENLPLLRSIAKEATQNSLVLSRLAFLRRRGGACDPYVRAAVEQPSYRTPQVPRVTNLRCGRGLGEDSRSRASFVECTCSASAAASPGQGRLCVCHECKKEFRSAHASRCDMCCNLVCEECRVLDNDQQFQVGSAGVLDHWFCSGAWCVPGREWRACTEESRARLGPGDHVIALDRVVSPALRRARIKVMCRDSGVAQVTWHRWSSDHDCAVPLPDVLYHVAHVSRSRRRRSALTPTPEALSLEPGVEDRDLAEPTDRGRRSVRRPRHLADYV